MARYIDAKSLAKVYMAKGKDRLRLSTVINELELAPSLDVVEVVRCKDCIHRRVAIRCALWYGSLGDKEYFAERGDDFYCAFGQRKEQRGID